MAAAKNREKKNIEYELNINLIYHIGSHIMTDTIPTPQQPPADQSGKRVAS